MTLVRELLDDRTLALLDQFEDELRVLRPDLVEALNKEHTPTVDGRATRRQKKKADRAKAQAQTEDVVFKGAPCAAPDCENKIPAHGEPGYHARRRYCPTHSQAARQRFADQRATFHAQHPDYVSKKDARRQSVNTAPRAHGQVLIAPAARAEATREMLSIPPQTKLTAQGFPCVCAQCGALVSEDVPYLMACTQEHHTERKKLGPKLSREEVREIQLRYSPTQIHPQAADNDPLARPEKRTRSKRGAHKHSKTPTPHLDPTVDESGRPHPRPATSVELSPAFTYFRDRVLTQEEDRRLCLAFYLQDPAQWLDLWLEFRRSLNK